MMDQMLLGEFSSADDWQEALEEYDRDWYIGVEREPGWTAAILAAKPNLFSIGHNTAQVTTVSSWL